ncbi:NAD(P)-binding protein [Periconia macrospinosa]|uniref:NAD(P)-binding protein n=1 Tax=Periconia macrospinosa TaxID=97972 RepID=A0A2V1E7A7_9PLEO|nr:NAD(P)-binding protein [Periconia macrospinosa]
MANERHQSEASWALVTGASGGIGRALSSELAARGFNVILHARNETGLLKVVDQLQKEHPTRKFRHVVADAAFFTSQDIEKIVAAVADIKLTVLINNVGGTGILSTNFMPFEDYTPKEIHAIFSLNVQFPLQLTHALLPHLRRASPTPSLVLTIGSQSNRGQPYAAPYSATKGALHTWNRAFAAEQVAISSRDPSSPQVDVLEAVVGATYTSQLQKEESFQAGLFMPSPETMAKAILARAGNGHRSVEPYFWHRVQSILLYDLMPANMADAIIANILGATLKPKAD